MYCRPSINTWGVVTPDIWYIINVYIHCQLLLYCVMSWKCLQNIYIWTACNLERYFNTHELLLWNMPHDGTSQLLHTSPLLPLNRGGLLNKQAQEIIKLLKKTLTTNPIVFETISEWMICLDRKQLYLLLQRSCMCQSSSWINQIPALITDHDW